MSHHKSELWAVTCYFNPGGYRLRKENYREFRRQLSVPLVAVELSFDGTFELDQTDADLLIQLTGRHVMWQKERLLNVGIAALPAACQKFVWVDCDVVFTEPTWAEQTADALDDFILVQPFDRAVDLARGATLDSCAAGAPGRISRGLACEIAGGTDPRTILMEMGLRVRLGLAGGFAWAGRRDVFGATGLYDVCIMGSGSGAIHNAAWGLFDCTAHALRMNQSWRDHFEAWGRSVSRAADGRVGYVKGRLLHLWHGDLRNRKYVQRHVEFSRFKFDPRRDIARDNSGCWRWNSDKSEMHDYVRGYFFDRLDDG